MPFTESSGELCYFWAGSISAWHQPGNWTVNILYGWPPSSSALASRGSRFVLSKGRAGEEKGDWTFEFFEPGCSGLFCFFFCYFCYFSCSFTWEKERMRQKSQANTELGCLCIGNWCLWAKREDEVGGLLLTWQEADIWKSHLCQRRVWPVVRCLSVLELLNQSWPRIVEGGPNYPPSPVPFQKMLSWMLMKAWHKYKHFNGLSSLLCTFESSRPCCNMSNNELLVAKWCSLLNCNASGFFPLTF